jgi:hypothetical protein
MKSTKAWWMIIRIAMRRTRTRCTLKKTNSPITRRILRKEHAKMMMTGERAVNTFFIFYLNERKSVGTLHVLHHRHPKTDTVR